VEDTYYTLTGNSSGEFKDRGSKFIGFAIPVESEIEIQEFIKGIKKLHPKSRHFCYGWRLGFDGQKYRANDDGEPSGTAGKPILGQIDSKELTNVCIVVVRYFGGTLLGTSGLIQAYREAAKLSISNGEIIQKIRKYDVRIKTSYSMIPDLSNFIKKWNLEITKQDYGLIASTTVLVRMKEIDKFVLELKSSISGMPIEMISEETEIPGFALEILNP
jgi:uncharacterized YigZ family protein